MKALTLLLVVGIAAGISSLLAGEKAEKAGTWRGQSITEFEPDEVEKFDWQVVNDGVMGGLSKGKVEFTDDRTMKFSGNLSLKNNGGFSTVRSGDVKLDLSNDLGLLLRVKGDGRTYEARLASDARYRGMEVSFSGEFETKEGEWQEVKVPFASFKGSFRGIDLNEQTLNPAKIQRVGVLLGDKREGPFDLEVDWIRTYGRGHGSKDVTSSRVEPATLVETALADGRFKTLATALTKADLVEALQEKGPLTVFAPTDKAFAKLPKKLVADLLKPENKEKLVSILTYHVSPGANGLGDALKLGEIPTLQGATIGVAFSEGSIRVNESLLVNSDIKCSNGIIHVIDSVLLPPEPPKPERQTILSVAEEAGSFSTLLAAVKAAGLDATLEGKGPFTVFAPTDDAFAALPKGTVESLLKKENRDKLAAILTYHVVPGRVTAGDALSAAKAETVQGASLKFGIRDGLLKVNDSTIKTVDLDGGNGVIHVIDAVLLPPAKAEEADKMTKAGASKSPMELIASAINKGVPLYNGGDPAACAEVYQACLSQLAESEMIDEGARKMLSRVVEAGKRHRSDDGRAWLYRKALDGMVAHLNRRMD